MKLSIHARFQLLLVSELEEQREMSQTGGQREIWTLDQRVSMMSSDGDRCELVQETPAALPTRRRVSSCWCRSLLLRFTHVPGAT